MNNAIGRYWGSATSAKLTEFTCGDAVIEFTWDDGAGFVQDYATHADARAALVRLGFTT